MTVTPGQPIIESSEATATTIFISWSVPSGFVAEQYKIEWSSHQCPGSQAERNAITEGESTNVTLPGLRASTEFNISVTAINPAGHFTSDELIVYTLEMGKCIGIVECVHSIMIQYQ